MTAETSFTAAREILGADLLGPDEITRAFGLSTGVAGTPVPFTLEQLRNARAAGEMLVLRLDALPSGAPLTITRLIATCPEMFDTRRLRQMGYQLKDEWGIALEPLASQETPQSGWALVKKAVLAETRNLDYAEQEIVLARCASTQALPGSTLRRRTAVEAVYDTVLFVKARRLRLLDTAWDWTSSRTLDGGFLNVGGFGPAGLQVLSYSPAVRHGALGFCPTRQVD